MSQQEYEHLLKRAVAEVIVEDELTDLLRSGKKLRLKEGFDPSFPDIHLGHIVTLRKLRQFQDLGHQVVLIVGDWTAQIGDPSGVSVTRPMLTMEQVQENAKTYMEQFFKVVDKERTEVRWQSEWFGKFSLADVIQLTSKFTVAQMLAREDFSNRYKNERPIAITELLYPLLQAYDSVAIESDVEFGGTDQKFNLLVGRELQHMVGQRPQQVFMVPLLVGTDGTHKMSKSLGNYIGVAEPPEEIYGKAMSIPDNLIILYFELVTDVSNSELADFRQSLENDAINPMELKKRLARELVSQLYSQKEADWAEVNFVTIHQMREVPEEITVIITDRVLNKIRSMSELSPHQVQASCVDISKLLVAIGWAKSRSDANRLIKQGAFRIDGEQVMNNISPVRSGNIIKLGKRRFAKVIDTDTITE